MGHGVPLLARRKNRGLTRILLALGLTPIFLAAAQTAVLIEAGDGDLRADLRWLADRGVIDVSASAWPLPLQAVREALASRKTRGLSAADEDALSRVEREVRRQTGLAYGLRADANTGSFPQTDFQRQARAEGVLSAYAQHASGALAGRLQANALSDPLTASQDDANLEGTYLAANIGGQILYAGQIAHFWGPGNNASLIWSNAATAIPGLGLRRAAEHPFEAKWLSWLGPWTYELFLGQMLNYSAVPDTRIAALRFSARPLEELELGGSYLQQWGGEGFDNSLGGLFNRPNSEDPNQPNNAIAGFDLRYTFRGLITLYGQAAGEDEANFWPSKWVYLVGAEFKHSLRSARLQWYVEAADTTANVPGVAYNHSVYTGGFYHDGLPIGHVVGGDGEIYSAGAEVVPSLSTYGLRYRARVFSAQLNAESQAINAAFPRNAKLYGVELGISATVKWADLRVALATQRDRSRAEDDISAFVAIELPLDRKTARGQLESSR